MRLTEQERKILAAAHLNAEDPVKELSRASGCREHQIRYCLQKFIDANTIERRPVIDLSKLGYTEFNICISVTHQSSAAREKFRTFVVNSMDTGDVIGVGGSWDYFIEVCVRDVSRLHQFLREASSIPGTKIIEKQLAARVATSLMRRTYLAKTKNKLVQYVLGVVSRSYSKLTISIRSF